MTIDIGNLWLRDNCFETVDSPPLDVHKHEEDHVVFLMLGGIKLENWKPDGEVDNEVTGDYYAPAIVNIPKENRHKATPLVEGTQFYCVFSKYLPNGQIARGK